MTKTAAIIGTAGYTGQETLDRVLAHPGLELIAAGSNTFAGKPGSAHDPRLGDRIQFVPGYTDTTIHLHEEIVALRGGRIEAVWKVTARDKIK